MACLAVPVMPSRREGCANHVPELRASLGLYGRQVGAWMHGAVVFKTVFKMLNKLFQAGCHFGFLFWFNLGSENPLLAFNMVSNCICFCFNMIFNVFHV